MKRQVELFEKNKPQQERAKRTYDAILAAAAGLLVEVGVERISTNLIADRAGITVPALYRYFPNKYAVLYALGTSLMDRQNLVVQHWVERHAGGDVYRALDDISSALLGVYQVTREQPGGLEIVQSVRAVGPLQEARLASRRAVAGQLANVAEHFLPSSDEAQLALKARLTVDMACSLVDLALEDPTVSPTAVMDEGANLLRSFWQSEIHNVAQSLEAVPK